MIKTIDIARIAYETVSQLAESIGIPGYLAWKDLDDREIYGFLRSVVFVIDYPMTTPDSLHNAWVQVKIDDGWKYGDEIDRRKKLHNHLQSFGYLTPFQRAEYFVFLAVVKSLLDLDYKYEGKKH